MGRSIQKSGIRTSMLLLAESNCQKLVLCSQSLAQFFLFCYETGFVFITEEQDIFQEKNLSWIGVIAKVHFMGRFE